MRHRLERHVQSLADVAYEECDDGGLRQAQGAACLGSVRYAMRLREAVVDHRQVLGASVVLLDVVPGPRAGGDHVAGRAEQRRLAVLHQPAEVALTRR
jgi:hypothetical protein